MKKLLIYSFLMAAAACTKPQGGEEPETVPVSEVSLDKNEITVTTGSTESLEVTVLPENATDKTIEWSSSDNAVASVADGKVTGVSAGEAVVTVKSADGAKTAECRVIVRDAVVDVERIVLSKDKLELLESDQAQLKAEVFPENATNKNFTWKTSDESVVTVADGLVTAVGEGNAVITVVTEDGGKTADCAVAVGPLPDIVIEGDTYYGEGIAFGGESVKLTANIPVKWSSGDETVAKVSPDGTVVFQNTTADTDVTITAARGSKSADIVFHYYKTEIYLDYVKVEDEDPLRLPVGGTRTYYLKYGGSDKISVDCYDVKHDYFYFSSTEDDRHDSIELKGIIKGNSEIRFVFNGGFEIRKTVIVG